MRAHHSVKPCAGYKSWRMTAWTNVRRVVGGTVLHDLAYSRPAPLPKQPASPLNAALDVCAQPVWVTTASMSSGQSSRGRS